MGASLKFNKDQVSIVFSNGKESIFFESKEEALNALIDCHQKSKITEQELNAMATEIINSSLKSVLLEEMKKALDQMTIIVSAKRNKSNDVFASLCGCRGATGAPHAYIYDEEGNHIAPTPFYSKMQGYAHCEELLQDGIISEKEYISLKSEIDLLKIPESLQDN
ncbi:MAG: hypothetical protein WC011_01080 [Candidatus Paceibacterota bacterium]